MSIMFYNKFKCRVTSLCARKYWLVVSWAETLLHTNDFAERRKVNKKSHCNMKGMDIKATVGTTESVLRVKYLQS